MINIITKKTKRGDVSFLFGVRTLATASKLRGIDSVKDFLNAMLSPGFEDIATMLFAGHENACFFQKTDLVYTDVDDCYELIEDIGFVEAMGMVAGGIAIIAGDSEGKKKAGNK